MADRILKFEVKAGRFLPPNTKQEQEEELPESKAGDMVQALLANEAKRKKELESKKQQEESAASKLKELKAMSIEDLKKALEKAGRKPAGKREELMAALFEVRAQEEQLDARKAELKAMSVDDLKNMLTKSGVEESGRGKDALLQAVLAH